MNSSSRDRRTGSEAAARLGGGLVALLVAVGLFTRFGIDSSLSRDEGIYAYGGRRLAHGVPPYVSIFDPKAPLATMIAGVAATAARLVHSNDLYAIRVAFFACACLTVLAVYLLAARLFGSTLAGVTAGVVFAADWPFAVDALTGPNAKTPGVLFAVVSMWLMARRQWFWAAFAGALAFLVWQPLVVYPFVAVLLALVTTRERRWRTSLVALLGAALPVVLVAAYFTAAGALRQLVEAALVFPLTGVDRSPETVLHRLRRIVGVVDRDYGLGGLLFWVGLGLLVLLVLVHLLRARGSRPAAPGAPLASVVLLTLLLDVAYAATDFQSYPDLYPFLPYPAIGLAGGVAALVALLRVPVARLGAAVAVGMALAVLTIASWVSFTHDPAGDHGLRVQRADACAVRSIQVPGTPIWSLGDPSVLVTTRRTNPDRFIYLGSGVARWKMAHLSGGFDGWTRQIQRARPSVVVVKGWSGPLRQRMGTWLRGHGYRPGFVGTWRVFATGPALSRAAGHGVRLTPRPTEVAAQSGGRQVHGRVCG
jgi:4-amino-4-deoxy-L-arabinose transferase-like glycosyltransferase